MARRSWPGGPTRRYCDDGCRRAAHRWARELEDAAGLVGELAVALGDRRLEVAAQVLEQVAEPVRS